MRSRNGKAPTTCDSQGLSLSEPSKETNMNIVAKSDLTFQNFTFTPVLEKGRVWITSTELAKVLKYKKTDAISQIYARNADEFTDAMTMTLNMRVNGINNSLRNKSVRVYSLRGCHLIAMFATTEVAKEFRRWVLDILDREVANSPIAKQFSDEEIIYLCYMQVWMEKSQRMSEALYPAMEDIGSKFASTLYDMAKGTRFMIDKNRTALVRESQDLDRMNFVVRSAEKMLALLNGKERIH